MKKYIGITIGPIFETLSLTSSPVALWAASYCFSSISGTICELLVKDGLPEEKIITPYFSMGDALLNQNNGIGMFHDRIIFEAGDYEISRLKSVKENALKMVAESLGIDAEYFGKYVMIADAVFEAENPIIGSEKILSSLELAVPFVDKEEINPILALFVGEGEGKNSGLKNTALVKSITDFQLKKDNGSFLSLEDITRRGTGYKKYNYYAILKADGDNMAKVIAALKDDGEIRSFSKKCLEYCREVAELVLKYEGVTIYSGGDDLLAIIPCENSNALTPFHFTKEANECFIKAFAEYGIPVSLSFGIKIAYYKYPLYEAFEDVTKLLFETAKKDVKNAVAVNLQKHSGQSMGFFIPNQCMGEIITLLERIREFKISGSDKERVFLSAARKLALFENLFNQAEDDKEIANIFKNTFDADAHKDNEFLEKTLPEFFVKLKEDIAVRTLDEDGKKICSYALAMSSILLMLKLFFEKGGEE